MKKIKIAGFPLTTYCNLNCQFCQRKELLKKKVITKKHLTLKKFKKILEKLNDVDTISISSGYGEPSLNPYFAEIIEHAKKNKKRIIMFTNGNILNKKIIKIMARKIDTLIISLDYAEKNKYNKIRKGGNLKNVIKTIKLLNYYKNKYNFNSTNIIISKVFLKNDNLETIKKLIDFAKKHMIERVEIRDKYPLDKKNCFIKKMPKNIIKKIARYAKKNHIELIVPSRKKIPRCNEVENNLYFDIDGNIHYCCFDPTTLLGVNILSSNFAHYYSLRQDLIDKFKRKEFPKKCLKCPSLFFK